MQSIQGVWGLAARLKGRPPGPAARTTRPGGRRAPRLEPLEARDAPATLVSPFRVTYQDADGDDVTVTLSRPLLNPDTATSVFDFDTGTVDGDNSVKQQLRAINVGDFEFLAPGLSITVTAAPGPAAGGDGLAAVGRINAGNQALGVVTIDGDLGQLDGGFDTPGLRGLAVHSLGRFGLATGATEPAVTVRGPVAFLHVATDVTGVEIQVLDGGGVGSVFVGGSLVGGAEYQSGSVSAEGDIGSVFVGSLVGGTGDYSGAVLTVGDIGPVTVRGDVIGGSGQVSGGVYGGGRLGPVTVGGSVVGGAEYLTGGISGTPTGPTRIGGDVVGGSGDESGVVSGGPRLTVGGSVRGGAGDGSGKVSGAAVTVRGDLIGGAAGNSGAVFGGRLGVTVGGSVVGGTGGQSGQISGGALGPVRIGGDLVGGPESGAVYSEGPVAGVTVGGSVRGGTIYAGGRLGPVVIRGDLIGTGNMTGRVEAAGRLAAITVGGSVVGGAGDDSGQIAASAGMGPVVIRGDLAGGAGYGSGAVYSLGPVARVTVGGSIRGGTGLRSGGMELLGPVGAVGIGGNLVGGSASGSADLTDSGKVEAGRIARLTIGGSLIAGTDDTTGTFRNNGAVEVFDDIGSVFIQGSILGNPTNPAVIAARGQAVPTATSDLAIGRLIVLGRVEHALIQAGVNINPMVWNPDNADAQIGPVVVGGDWIASSLAAGAVPGANGFFGDADDAKIAWPDVKDDPRVSSRIVSWTVGGKVVGTAGGTDYFGVVAEVVGAVTVGGNRIPTAAGKGNDDFPLGITGDFRVNEL